MHIRPIVSANEYIAAAAAPSTIEISFCSTAIVAAQAINAQPEPIDNVKQSKVGKTFFIFKTSSTFMSLDFSSSVTECMLRISLSIVSLFLIQYFFIRVRTIITITVIPSAMLKPFLYEGVYKSANVISIGAAVAVNPQTACINDTHLASYAFTT